MISNRKKLHWSYSIPTWYWILVMLPLGIMISMITIIGFMLWITS